MIRRSIIVVMLAAALITLALGLASVPFPMWWDWGQRPSLPFGSAGLSAGTIGVHHYRSGRSGADFRINFAGIRAERFFATYYRAEDHSLKAGFWTATNVQDFYMEVPLWMACVLFSLYPAATFMGSRYRRHRRRKRGGCVKCGYDLTGNVSGRCPECGEPAKLGRF